MRSQRAADRLRSLREVLLRRAASTHRRWLVAMTCVVALAAPIGVAWASSTNYAENVTLDDGGYRETPGVANRTYNEVWRPSGYYFKLVYSGDTVGKGGTENPLYDPRSWSLAHAACQNQSGVNGIYPVTCQTDGA